MCTRVVWKNDSRIRKAIRVTRSQRPAHRYLKKEMGIRGRFYPRTYLSNLDFPEDSSRVKPVLTPILAQELEPGSRAAFPDLPPYAQDSRTGAFRASMGQGKRHHSR